MSIRLDENMELRAAECQFVEIDSPLDQRAEIEADINAAEMGQGCFIGRFQSAKSEVIEPDAPAPEAPVQIRQGHGCARPALDFLNDVVTCTHVECGRFEVGDHTDAQ